MKKVPEHYRITKGNELISSTEEDGNNGSFRIPQGLKHHYYYVRVSDMGGWEHISVSVKNEAADMVRTPYWSEMCAIKDMFFEKHEVVIQYHPAEEDYVNIHKHVLHLWRPTDQEIPKPPKIFV